MKKIASVLLAGIILSAVSVTASAEGQDTQVKFEVDPSYTVIIPPEIILDPQSDGTYAKDAAITASDVRLKYGQGITVALESDYTLTSDEGAELAYSVIPANNVSGDAVAQFKTDTADQTAVIKFQAGVPEFSGNYKDTVTFVISVS